MAVFYFTPFSIDKNLGKAYNTYASLVSNNDWLCFVDRDVMFLNHDYGNIIEEIIAKYPTMGLFTCLTNRVGNLNQCYNRTISEDPNVINHYRIAEKLAKEKRHEIAYHHGVISGHFMLIKKETWNKIFGAKNGLLTVDNDISRKVIALGMKVAVMQGLYVFHYYRFHNGRQDKSHLK